jgi:hypothetical protein
MRGNGAPNSRALEGKPCEESVPDVAGLPVVHEPPTTLTMEAAANAIGSRLGPYSIAGMQEDFNYHAYIYATDTHPYRTATSGPAGIGDGLNTVSNYPFEDFTRVTWSSCYPDNGDCLTPKGFSFMRMELATGVYVDFINLHTNAGTSSGDETARENEWAQLTSWIAANVPAGDALIVAGDTNSRYTRTLDDLQSFVAGNGLTDAWMQLELGGTAPAAGSPDLVCNEAAITNTFEVTNKVLYRSSRWVTLRPTYYNNEHAKFLDSSGLMLSDMDPILTDFSWTSSVAASDERDRVHARRDGRDANVPEAAERRVPDEPVRVPGLLQLRLPPLLRQVDHQPRPHLVRRGHDLGLHDLHRAVR